MHRLATAAMAAAIGLGSFAFSAEATPVRYEFDATAELGSTISGPFKGWFTIDLDKIWFTYSVTDPDGSHRILQGEDAWEHPTGLIEWQIPGDARTYGRVAEASIVRRLNTDGSSELTLNTFAASSGGGSTIQAFTLTYFSLTDVLYTQPDPFLNFDNVASASGSHAYDYEYFDEVPIHKQSSFVVTSTTAVPEPNGIAVALLGGAGMVLAIRKQRRGACAIAQAPRLSTAETPA